MVRFSVNVRMAESFFKLGNGLMDVTIKNQISKVMTIGPKITQGHAISEINCETLKRLSLSVTEEKQTSIGF